MLYMEFQGTNQMRWVADYMKAKAGGRYSGTCVNINYTAAEMSYGNNTQCGALSIERVGGVKPDYFWDAFWDDLLFFNWHVEDFGIYSNNFTSWFHFVNLLKTTKTVTPSLRITTTRMTVMPITRLMDFRILVLIICWQYS